jgi:hypothetical protein
MVEERHCPNSMDPPCKLGTSLKTDGINKQHSSGSIQQGTGYDDPRLDDGKSTS